VSKSYYVKFVKLQIRLITFIFIFTYSFLCSVLIEFYYFIVGSMLNIVYLEKIYLSRETVFSSAEKICTRIEMRREEKLGYICLSENDLISFLHLHHKHIHEEIKRRRSLQMSSGLIQEAIKNVGRGMESSTPAPTKCIHT
jgi:hypothetical protein